MTTPKTMKMSSGGTVVRTPSYFVWNHRKNVSSSPRSSPYRMAANTNTNMNNRQDQDGVMGDVGPSPRKMRSPRSRTSAVAGADNQSTDTKSSGVSGDSGGFVAISPKHKDPDRIRKDREREERVRQARERLNLERKKKLVDLQEQQRQAQENREKQLEMRRKKIEDLRRRDVERRAEVEKRRREKDTAERSRRETLLLKAEERVARYEAWKRSGQKGPPPGGVIPTNVAKHLSASTSVLYHKRNSEFSSSGVLDISNRPDSLLERSRARGPGSARRSEEKEKKGEKVGTKKMSRHAMDRLSTPRQLASVIGDSKDTIATPKRESNIARKSSTREKTPKEASTKSLRSTTSAATGTTSGTASPSSRTPSRTPVRVVSPTPSGDEDGGSSMPQTRPTPNIMDKSTGDATASSTPNLEKSTGDINARSTTSVMEKSTGDAMARSTSNVMEKSTGDISAEQYKAKLAEKRRQAREKAEKEAEEERKRQEELERQEEERMEQEEEEQRLRDEEAMKFAEEASRAEEQRLQKAIEAEDARKAQEAARLEQEKLAKEEADRKAKEEAERLEQEKQEKARRDEEERLERKKRLEMIMKRVKTDGPGEAAKDSSKSVTSSPSKSVNSTASSDTSPTDPDNKTVLAMAAQSVPPGTYQENGNSQAGPVRGEEASQSAATSSGPASPITTSHPHMPPADSEPEPERDLMEKSGVMEKAELEEDVAEQVPIATRSSSISQADHGGDKPRFKSPLLQKLVGGKEENSSSQMSGPKFKSPLLQNLLGKTKARMGLAQEHSTSDPILSHIDQQANGESQDIMSSSMIEMGSSDSNSKELINSSEEKDVDMSEEDSSSTHSSPSRVSGKTVVSNGNEEGSSIALSVPSPEDISPVAQPEPMEISMPMESSTLPASMAASAASLWSEQDSGVSFESEDLLRSGATPSSSLQVSYNGHGPARTAQQQGLEDSSISMRSVESVTSSITDSAAGSVFSSVSSLPPSQGLSSGDKDFEEVIDLPVNNKSSTSTNSTSARTVLDNSDDLVNFNKLEEDSQDTTAVPPTPIIAFEDHRKDVPDLLS